MDKQAIETSIGLKKGTVKLSTQKPDWKREFEKEKKILLDNFPGVIREVSHGGSTAIPNIPAKPLIDIFAVVSSLKAAEEIKPKMEALGYEYRGEEGVPERRFYAKGNRNRRTVNLHFVEADSQEWKNHLLIKNYLLARPDIAQQYARLKQKLAEQYPNDRVSYRHGKDAFINDIIKKTSQERVK